MSEVFLSYAKEDRPRARILAEALERQGWSVWWDREIPVGGVFDEVIERELTAARVVIVLWSERSVHSRWVKAEAEAAVERNKLFPVLIDRVPIPLAFRQFQAADLVEWDGGRESAEFPHLVSELGQRLGQGPGAVPTAEAHRDEPRRDLPRRRPARWLLSGLIVFFLVVASIWVWRELRPSDPGPVTVPRESQPPPVPPEDEADEHVEGAPVQVVPRSVEPLPERPPRLREPPGLELFVVTPDGPRNHHELLGGADVEMAVRLSEPARETLRIELRVLPGTDLLFFPEFVEIPGGAREGPFVVEARPVGRPTDLVIEARLGDHARAEAHLSLLPRPGEPIGLELFFVTDEGPRNHHEMLGGEEVPMAVRLSEPAPETLGIELRGQAGTDLLIFPEFVEIPGGSREGPFVVEARPVGRPTDLVIEARLGDHARAEAHLSLLPRH